MTIPLEINSYPLRQQAKSMNPKINVFVRLIFCRFDTCPVVHVLSRPLLVRLMSTSMDYIGEEKRPGSRPTSGCRSTSKGRHDRDWRGGKAVTNKMAPEEPEQSTQDRQGDTSRKPVVATTIVRRQFVEDIHSSGNKHSNILPLSSARHRGGGTTTAALAGEAVVVEGEGGERGGDAAAAATAAGGAAAGATTAGSRRRASCPSMPASPAFFGNCDDSRYWDYAFRLTHKGDMGHHCRECKRPFTVLKEAIAVRR